MRRGCAFGCFGIVTSTMPLRPVACTPAASTVSGNVKRRWKRPCGRSTRLRCTSLPEASLARSPLSGEQALVERDLDGREVDARNVELQHEAVRVLLDVRRRNPVGGRRRGCGVAVELAVEQAIDLPVQLIEHTPGLIANECHGRISIVTSVSRSSMSRYIGRARFDFKAPRTHRYTAATMPALRRTLPLLAMSLLMSGAATAAAAPRYYDVAYRAHFRPDAGIVEMEIALSGDRLPSRVVLHVDPRRHQKFTSTDPLQIEPSHVTWQPRGHASRLRYQFVVNHERAPKRYDSRMTDDWAIFRAEKMVPRASVTARTQPAIASDAGVRAAAGLVGRDALRVRRRSALHASTIRRVVSISPRAGCSRARSAVATRRSAACASSSQHRRATTRAARTRWRS